MGSTASDLKVSRYGVSSIKVRCIARYPQSTFGISSAHLPRHLSTFFLSDATIVLFVDLTCPLDWGWATEV